MAKEAAGKKDETPAKPKQPVQHGITLPRAGTTSGKIYDIANQISAKLGAPAPRKDVMTACEKAGFNAATAATQYGRWRKYNGLQKEVKPKTETPETAGDGAGTEGSEAGQVEDA